MYYIVGKALLESGKFRDEIPFVIINWSIEREPHILMNELQKLPKMPRELIEREI